MTTREKNLLFILGLLILLIIGGNRVIGSNLKSRYSLQEELEGYRLQEKAIKDLLDMEEEVEQAIEKGISEMDKLAEPFFEYMYIEEIDRWLQVIAKQTGVNIDSLYVEEANVASVATSDYIQDIVTYPISEYYQLIYGKESEVEEESIDELGEIDQVVQVPVTIEVAGEQNQVINFIDKISNSGKHVVIQEFDLGGNQNRIHLIFYMIEK